MGRIRKTARFIFSVGGYDGLSPVAKESERTKLLREQNKLLAEQNRLAARASRPTKPARERRCPSCREPITSAADGSVPFVHVATGDFAC